MFSPIVLAAALTLGPWGAAGCGPESARTMAPRGSA